MARIVVVPIYQIILGVAVLFASLQVHVYARPYSMLISNRLEFASIFASLTVLYSGWIFYSGKLPDGRMDDFIAIVVIIVMCGAAVLVTAALYFNLQRHILSRFNRTQDGDYIDKHIKDMRALPMLESYSDAQLKTALEGSRVSDPKQFLKDIRYLSERLVSTSQEVELTPLREHGL